MQFNITKTIEENKNLVDTKFIYNKTFKRFEQRVGEKWQIVNENLKKIISEPTGFAVVNNESDIYSSVITFSVDGSRMLSISPTNEHFIFYINGKQFIKTDVNQVQISDMQGLHYIYFNENGILESRTDFFISDMLKKYVSVATVYWDFKNKKAIYIGDKRHSINSDSYQNYLDFINDQSVDYIEGTNIKFTNSTDGSINDRVDGDGSSNYHSSFAINSGKYRNYDLILDSEHIEFNENIPIFYKETINDEKNWLAMAAKPDGSVIVAITNEGEYRLMMSRDQGETWNKIYLSFYSTWIDIIYAQNKFIVIANSGPHLAISSEDGFNWTTLAIPQKNKWQSIAYGNNIFVAVSIDGNNRIMTSENGTLWITKNIPYDLPLKKVKFIKKYENNPGKFIAFTDEDITKINGNGVKYQSKAFYSFDGINWEIFNISEEKDWACATLNNGKIIGLARTGKNKLLNTSNINVWPTYELSNSEIDSQNWSDIVYYNGYYMAISNTGSKRFIRSTNGTNWESFNTLPENSWKKMAFSTTALAVIADNENATTGKLQYSVNSNGDNISWTANTVHDNKKLEDIIFGDKWVLISSNNTNRISYSSNLANWNEIATRDNVYWKSIAYGNNTYVAVGEEDTDWKLSTINNTHSWESIAFGRVTATNADIFVAVSSDAANSEKVMTSTDGITWTISGAVNSRWKSITYGTVSGVGTFVAVAEADNNRVMRSINGTTWTSGNAAEQNSWQSVAFGAGVFVAVSKDGNNRVMRSTDGINWTTVNVPLKEWKSVIFGGGIFMAVAKSSTPDINGVMTSVDGLNWSLKSTGTPGSWNSVTYGSNFFVIINDGTLNQGVAIVYNSIDNGNNWQDITPSVGDFYCSDIIFQNNKFIIVGINLILKTEDFEYWEKINIPMNLQSAWNKVAFGNNRFVAVAVNVQPSWTSRVMTDFVDNNKIIWSADGIAWSNSSISVNKNWKKIKYLTNNQNSGFFALSTDNKVYYSIDGKDNWRNIPIPSEDLQINDFFSGVTYLVFLTNKNKVITTGTNITAANFSEFINIINIVDNFSFNDIESSDNGQVVITIKPNKILASKNNTQDWIIKELLNFENNKIKFFKNNFFLLSNSSTNRVCYFNDIFELNYKYISSTTLPYSFVDMLYLNNQYIFLINTGSERIIKTNQFIEVEPENIILEFKKTIKDIYSVWRREDNLNENEIVKNRCLIFNQRINFNKFDNGYYKLETCADNKFYLYHLFMTNDKDNKYMIFAGNFEYSSKEEAKNNILNEINKFSGLPFNDFLSLGTIIYEANFKYKNSPKARIVNINGNNYYKLIKKDLINNDFINKKENTNINNQLINNSDLINLYGKQILEYALNKLQNLTSRDIDNFITRKEITLTTNGGIDNIINIFGTQITGSYEIFDKNNPDTNMIMFLKQIEGEEPEINITSFSNLIIPNQEKGQSQAVLGVYIDNAKNIVLKNFSETSIKLVIYRKI